MEKLLINSSVKGLNIGPLCWTEVHVYTFWICWQQAISGLILFQVPVVPNSGVCMMNPKYAFVFCQTHYFLTYAIDCAAPTLESTLIRVTRDSLWTFILGGLWRTPTNAARTGTWRLITVCAGQSYHSLQMEWILNLFRWQGCFLGRT